MKTTLITVFLCLLFCISHEKQLPSYVNKCKLKDPAVNDCMKSRLQEFTKYIQQGAKEFRFPPSMPFVVPEIKLNFSWMNATVVDVKLEPLYDYVVDTFSMDLDKGEIKIKISHKYVSFKGDYTLDGKLSQINIHGSGEVDAKSVDIVGDVIITGKKITKNSQEYFQVEKAIYKFIKRTTEHIYLGNLFGENVELTKRINDVIAENLEELFADVYPALEIVLSSLIHNLFKNTFDTFSLSELFD